jgi:long-chain acyl-CoA synthetase
VNLASFLIENARGTPDKDAIRCGAERVTWHELDRQTNSLAAALQRLGIAPGDRVSIMLPNAICFLVSYWAVIKAGGVASPINTMYRQEEIGYVFRNSGSKVLITEPQFLPLIDLAWVESTALEHIIVVADAVPFGAHRFADLIGNAAAPVLVEREPDDLCALHYTSGTTGRAKGVMITHRNWWVGMMQWHVDVWRIAPDDMHLVALPIFHTFGLMMTLIAFATGGTIRLLPRWDVQEVAGYIERERVTVFSGVPTMYVYLTRDINLEERDLSSLRLAVVGGAPIPVEIQREFIARTGVTVVDWYGCTGWASTTSPLWEADAPQKYGSIGKRLPYPEVEMRIVDEQDADLPIGAVGELIVRAPLIPPGFWRLPGKTARDFRNGWFHTGDLVRLDEDGYYFLVERKDDLIITAGYNVYPREVEEVLFSMPQVYEAAVIGAADPVKGEIVKAFVVLREGAQATPETVIAHCREHLANFKVPRDVAFIDALPKLPNGKILRRALREGAKDGAAV